MKCLVLLPMDKYKYTNESAVLELRGTGGVMQEDEAICSLVAQFGLNDWTKIA